MRRMLTTHARARLRATATLLGLASTVLATTPGCLTDLFESASGSSPRTPLLIFGMGAVVPGGPPAEPFQSRFLPDAFIFDLSSGSPRFLCEHDRDGTLRKLDEYSLPTDIRCAPQPEPPPPAPPPMHSGPDGTNATPDGYRSWMGGATGGCGTWSVAMCNRILHRTEPSSQVTQTEWDGIATSIRQDATGGSFTEDRSKIYRDAGYCTVTQDFRGTAEEYAEAARRFGMNCDLSLAFWKRTGPNAWTNGHVETITAVGTNSFTTNSWGHPATVTGGTAGGFRHDRPAGQMVERGTTTTLWPADATDAEITYVCPCGGFAELGQILLDEAAMMR